MPNPKQVRNEKGGYGGVPGKRPKKPSQRALKLNSQAPLATSLGYAKPSGYAPRNALVVENQGLVHAIARKSGLIPNTELYDEAVADAQLELIKAASRYDPATGAFTTYAWPWISRSIAETKASQGLVHIPAKIRRDKAQAERLGGWAAMVSNPGVPMPLPSHDRENERDDRRGPLSRAAWLASLHDEGNETEEQLAHGVDMGRALALLTPAERAVLSELIDRKDETRWNHLGRPAHELRDLIQGELA